MAASKNPTARLEIFLYDEDSRVVCRLRGELDTSTTGQLRAYLAERVAEDRDVVVDLAGVTFVDSSGLGVLVGALKRFQAEGHELSLRSPTPTLLRVLEMTGLARAFPLEA
jgi:anti-anti-sigma factor